MAYSMGVGKFTYLVNRRDRANHSGMRLWCCLGVLLVAASRPAHAQVIGDERTWWNVTVQERPSTSLPFRWSVEGQLRMRDVLETADQLLVRAHFGYDLTGRASLWGGYGYTASLPISGEVTHEHRVWQQFIWTGPVRGFVFTSRSRLEQRFFEASTTAWRVRQQVRVSRTVTSGSRLAAVAWNEVLLNLNSTARTVRGFDQNRAFAGLNLSIDRRSRVEFGYLNQFVNTPGRLDRRNHILSVVCVLAY